MADALESSRSSIRSRIDPVESVYYQVRGQRAIWNVKDEDSVGRRRIGTTKESVLRYESCSLQDAQAFATRVFRTEQIVCTIDEVDRAA